MNIEELTHIQHLFQKKENLSNELADLHAYADQYSKRNSATTVKVINELIEEKAVELEIVYGLIREIKVEIPHA